MTALISAGESTVGMGDDLHFLYPVGVNGAEYVCVVDFLIVQINDGATPAKHIILREFGIRN